MHASYQHRKRVICSICDSRSVYLHNIDYSARLEMNCMKLHWRVRLRPLRPRGLWRVYMTAFFPRSHLFWRFWRLAFTKCAGPRTDVDTTAPSFKVSSCSPSKCATILLPDFQLSEKNRILRLSSAWQNAFKLWRLHQSSLERWALDATV